MCIRELLLRYRSGFTVRSDEHKGSVKHKRQGATHFTKIQAVDNTRRENLLVFNDKNRPSRFLSILTSKPAKPVLVKFISKPARSVFVQIDMQTARPALSGLTYKPAWQVSAQNEPPDRRNRLLSNPTMKPACRSHSQAASIPTTGISRRMRLSCTSPLP